MVIKKKPKLIADKIDTKAGNITRNNHNHYTVIKVLIHWGNIATLHMSNTASKYTKQKYSQLKGKISKSTLIAGELTPVTVIEISRIKQNTKKHCTNPEDLNTIESI